MATSWPVTVDNQRAERANIEVVPGQEILIGPKVSFVRGSLRILHDDDDIIVLEKPEGLLSVATDFENRATVHAMLKRQFHNRRVYPVHRLDRETSGVMMFAYSEKARDQIKSQFEQQPSKDLLCHRRKGNDTRQRSLGKLPRGRRFLLCQEHQ